MFFVNISWRKPVQSNKQNIDLTTFCVEKLQIHSAAPMRQRWQRYRIGSASCCFFFDPDPVSLEDAKPDPRTRIRTGSGFADQRWSPRGHIL